MSNSKYIRRKSLRHWKIETNLIDSFDNADKDPYWREIAYCIQSSRMNEEYKFYFEAEENPQTLVY